MKRNNLKYVFCIVALLCLCVCNSSLAATLKIPAEVTKIEEEAFYGDMKLDVVLLPESIKRIESRAFAYSSVKRIYLPASLTYIAPDAFAGCTNVVGYGTDNTYASRYFDDTSYLTFERSGQSETSLDYFTFAGNDDGSCTLTKYTGSEMNVVIPSRDGTGRAVKYIGNQAFSGTGINSVYIPDSVERIGWSAFSGCTYLTDVRLSRNLLSLEPYNGSGGIFSQCTGLTTIEIPASVSSLGNSTFSDCKNLTEVILHEGLTDVGSYVFSNCLNVTEIVLPRTIHSIGSHAFTQSGITAISIPDTVISIGEYAFSQCTNLTEVVLPDSVTSIGANAFVSCKSLVSIDLSASLSSIGENAFRSCSSLVSLDIPDTVKSIGDYAFCQCSALAAINLPNQLTVINRRLFENCISLSYVEIPSTVTTISDSAFSGCTALSVVDLPEQLKSVGPYVFAGAKALTNITFPYGTTTIAEHVFDGCSGLVTVDMADSITSIGEYCFAGCKSLFTIQWPQKTSILSPYVLQGCSNLTEITLHEKVTGIGAYAFSGCNSLNTVELPSSMKSISASALSGSGIVSIDIPSTILTIGESAFYNCDKLTEVTFSPNLRSIGNSAFNDCDLLGEVYLPAALTSLSENLFRSCDALRTVHIPDAVTSIGDDCFYSCSSLQSMTIPSSVKSIGRYVFYDCGNMTSLTIPASVVSIGDNAFGLCNKLTIYGEAGSVAETVANTYSNVQFSPIYRTNTESQTSYVKYSGKVITSQGADVKGVTVTLTSGTSTVASVLTDDGGNWLIHAPQEDQSYLLSYSSPDYSFSENNIRVSAMGSQSLPEVTAQLSNTVNSDLTFVLSSEEIMVGSPLKAVVSAADYTSVRLVVDGIAYEEYDVQDGTADVSRVIHKSGTRIIQFQGCQNNTWKEISEPQSLLVTSLGELEKPEFTLPATHELMTELTVDWNSVDHAEQYVVYLGYEGTQLYIESVAAPAHQITFSEALFRQVGNYGIEVIAIGKGYSQRSYNGIISVGTQQITLTQSASLSNGIITVSVGNNAQKYVKIKVKDPDGEEHYITDIDATASSITGTFECGKPGEYAVQSFAYAIAGDTISEDVIARSTEKKLTYNVSDLKIYWCRVGDGKASQLKSDSFTVSAKSTGKFDEVHAMLNDELLGILNVTSSSPDADGNYEYTGNIQLSQESGTISVRFVGIVDQQENGTPRTFTFYLIKKWNASAVYYPIAEGTKAYSNPVNLTNNSEYLNQTTALNVVGEFGELFYAKKPNDQYVYVLKESVHQISPADIAAINIKCIRDSLEDHADPNMVHNITVSWTLENIPEGAQIAGRAMNNTTDTAIEGYEYTISNNTVSFSVSSSKLTSGQIILTIDVMTDKGILLRSNTTTLTIYATESIYKLHTSPTKFEQAFTNDARGAVNHSLANISIDFCDASDHGLSDVQNIMSRYGFQSVVGFDVTSGEHTAAHFFGHRVVLDENGEETTLFVALIRGTNGTVKEWKSNFTVGKGKLHTGFSLAENRVLSRLKEYINAYLPDGQTYQNGKYKLWVCGHSRGAAVGNLLCGHWDYIDSSDVFGYLFATPNPTTLPQAKSNIKNFVYQGDIVPRMVPVPYGYQRNGVTYYKDNGYIINGRMVTVKSELDILIANIYALFPNLSDLQAEIDRVFSKTDENSGELLSVDNLGAAIQLLLDIRISLSNPINYVKAETLAAYTTLNLVAPINWMNAINAHYIDAYRVWMRSAYPDW